MYKSLEISQKDYKDMKDYLETDSKYFQPYDRKVRTLNILRTLYAESLFRAYQERVKDNSGKGTSLVEREKELAFSGLNKDYYNNLRNKSMADVNLEILQAVNKLAYFVYKLHQDNERMALIMAVSGMQLTAPGIQDERLYIKPVGTLIENKCWKDDNKDKSECKNPIAGTPPKV